MRLSKTDERGAGVESRARMLMLSLLGGGIGVLAGGAAYALYVLIAECTNLVFFQRFGTVLPSIREHTLGAVVVAVPVLGALVVGVMAKYGSRKIKGHGIPEAMEAVLVDGSRIAPRVAVLKPLSAAIAIGTGGPFGAEGPIIQTGGAIGSLVGQLLHTTPSERKVLLACGAAAGMAATFSTPLAAVMLAIELLLFEFKTRSFVPLVIASAMATAMHYVLMGRTPLFQVDVSDFGVPGRLPYYLLLGVLCGGGAVLFSRVLYRLEDGFAAIPVDEVWVPAIGAVGLGVIGLFVPRVLGVGYDTIGDILANRLPVTLLLLIVIFKSAALLVSLSAGTSGGLLAPMFMVGAAGGALFATGINAAVPAAHLSPEGFALVSMAAFFGSAARAPFTFILFAFELTQDYHAVLPLMLASVVAQFVALVFMEDSIMTEKLARRGLRVHQDYEADVLRRTRVGAVMDPAPTTVPAHATLAEVAHLMSAGDLRLTRHQGFPVIAAGGRLVGLVTRGDVLRALEAGLEGATPIAEIGSTQLVVTFPDETLHDATIRMLRAGVGRMPVVDRKDPTRLSGYLGRTAILEARLGVIREELDVETGWIGRLTRRPANGDRPPKTASARPV